MPRPRPPASAGAARPRTDRGTGYNRPPDANGGHPRRRRAGRHPRAASGRPGARAPHRARRLRRGQGPGQGAGHPAVRARWNASTRGSTAPRSRGDRRARHPGRRRRAGADGRRRRRGRGWPSSWRRRSRGWSSWRGASGRAVDAVLGRGLRGGPGRGSAPVAVASAIRRRLAAALDVEAAAVGLALLGLPPDVIVVPHASAAVGGVPVEQLRPAAVRQAVQEVAGRTPGPVALAAAAARVIAALSPRAARCCPCSRAATPPSASAGDARAAAAARRMARGGDAGGRARAVRARGPRERGRGPVPRRRPLGDPAGISTDGDRHHRRGLRLLRAARARPLRELPGRAVRAAGRSGRYVHALYAFARAADDFADEPMYEGMRAEKLDQWEARLHAAYEGRAEDPIFIALARDRARASTSRSRCCSTCCPPSARTR